MTNLQKILLILIISLLVTPLFSVSISVFDKRPINLIEANNEVISWKFKLLLLAALSTEITEPKAEGGSEELLEVYFKTRVVFYLFLFLWILFIQFMVYFFYIKVTLKVNDLNHKLDAF